jgi:hypothetical protein
MRFVIGCALVVGLGCTTEGEAREARRITLPQVYPPVREATPTGLIANAQYAVATPAPGELGLAHQRQTTGTISLATAVQERFYSGGPTDILRIVKDLDDRMLGLDTDPSAHDCLTASPVPVSYTLPGGQSFGVKLQCLQEFPAGPVGGAGWVAFGFDQAAVAADAGPVEASEGNDFYLVEGQDIGMGGAYHISGATGSVEAWIAVADRVASTNSQVIMHLLTDKPAGTLELAVAGTGVGFCSGHLKADTDHLFVNGRTNGAPPPGAPMSGQYCDAARAGCFAIAALAMDLGEASTRCSGVNSSAFAMQTSLDASTDTGANVTPGSIYRYFGTKPSGVPAF